MHALLESGRGPLGILVSVVVPCANKPSSRLSERSPPAGCGRVIGGKKAAAGEWCLVCLACNLKRLHVLARTA